MSERLVYRGVVATGRGAGAVIMSDPSVLTPLRQLTGLAIIPGTMNVYLDRPFEALTMRYVSLSELGVELNLVVWGIEHDGEHGFHYHPVSVARRYPAFALCPTWVGYPSRRVELVSHHHLRCTLGLKDGDSVELALFSEEVE